ncbi:MAG: thioether cross-link-forming SCIFF peptide maturase [Firmicutes bacterium]|nr:thioether cross-link-forming SCIFF peptide maturase [Bacillota bacterium]
MLDKTCVHTFSQKGQHLAVDGNSGAVHVLDTQALDLINLIREDQEMQSIADLRAFVAQHPEYTEVGEEILYLIEEGLLFSVDLTEVPPRPESVVKALCLNVAHDCNLRCAYCFASTGDFEGIRELMPLEVAKAAVDFLIRASKYRKQLEIDFFGGEPLMNWDVVRDTVLYAKEEAKKHGKTFRFTITTNGLGLTPEIEDFINAEMYNVVLSLDGRKEVNDRLRHTVTKRGSVYDTIVPRFQRLVENRQNKSYYVRGTFTAHNLDFALDVAHLNDLGFEQISMEPVVTDPAEDYALREEHLPQILQEYERLAELYLERQATKPFNFFHFNVELKKGPCLYKRLSGCGAGYEYLAVTPQGELFPCHQFVGDEDYVLGDVWTGILNQELPTMLKDAHVLNNPVCKGCWGKYYCSGGCPKNNLEHAGNFQGVDELSCIMEKKRLECSFYIQACSTDI